MLSHPSVLAHPGFDALAALIALIVFGLTGHLLTGKRYDGGDLLERLVFSLVLGMTFLIGLGITLTFARPGLHTLQPVLVLGFIALTRRHLTPSVCQSSPRERTQFWFSTGVLFLAAAAFQAWHSQWVNADGHIVLDHSDCGFYAMLSKGLATAKVSTSWAATASSAAVEAGRTEDQWYHWGPVWLGLLITKVTGLPAIEAVLCAGSIVLTTILALTATAIVRVITGWSYLRCALVGAISIFAMPFPSALHNVSPFGYKEHSRESLLWNSAYYYEAVLVFGIALSWLRKRDNLTLLLIACATVSSPHFVGGAGIAVGTLMVVGLAMRDRTLWVPAASAVGVILLTWIALRFGFNAIVSADDKGSLSFAQVWGAAKFGTLSIGIELAICLLLIPGWLAFAKARGEPLSARTRLLGWISVAGIAGGMVATYLFTNAEDQHFTDFPITILSMPIAVWGFSSLMLNSKRWLRLTAGGLIAITAICGVTQLKDQKDSFDRTPWTVEEVTSLKHALNGEPFGYFTNKDRQWWLPKCAFLAALLDTRCIRLMPLKSADFDNAISFAQKSFLPMEMVAYKPGDSVPEWSMKLMRHMEIPYILDSHETSIPPVVLANCDRVWESGNMTLYRLKPTTSDLPQSAQAKPAHPSPRSAPATPASSPAPSPGAD